LALASDLNNFKRAGGAISLTLALRRHLSRTRQQDLLRRALLLLRCLIVLSIDWLLDVVFIEVVTLE